MGALYPGGAAIGVLMVLTTCAACTSFVPVLQQCGVGLHSACLANTSKVSAGHFDIDELAGQLEQQLKADSSEGWAVMASAHANTITLRRRVDVVSWNKKNTLTLIARVSPKWHNSQIRAEAGDLPSSVRRVFDKCAENLSSSCSSVVSFLVAYQISLEDQFEHVVKVDLCANLENTRPRVFKTYTAVRRQVEQEMRRALREPPEEKM